MAIAVGTVVVRLVNEVLSEREVTVRNDGASAVFVSTDPQMVASGAQTFSVASGASQDVTLAPGQSLFAICAAGQSASVEVIQGELVPMFGPYPAVVTDLHDGDTLHLNIDLGFGYIVSGHDLDGNPQLSCRVYGINAPELRTTAGKAALEYATGICPPGTRVTVTSHGWDKYGGRFDGEIILPDGTSFGERMLDAGQAVPLTN